MARALEEQGMTRWSAFAAERPDFAEAGARLFQQFGVALLATVASDGAPRLAPVCPILQGEHLYLIVAQRTPKARHLESGRPYALHALLGSNDEEFQVRGVPSLVTAAAERSGVHQVAGFSFDPTDPIFRLSVEHSLWCHWERVGKPDTKAVRRRWSAKG
jgi:hypothetical protein